MRHWPFASANLVACFGVAAGCLKRDGLSVAFAVFAAAATLGTAFILPLGRYFVPLYPVLLALGAAGWARYGGRLGLPALVLLVLAPALPQVVTELPDVRTYRALLARIPEVRTPDGESTVADPWVRCLEGRPLVVAEDASLVAWKTDASAVWLPAAEADLVQIVERHPVDYVWISYRRDVLTPRFRASFAPRVGLCIGLLRTHRGARAVTLPYRVAVGACLRRILLANSCTGCFAPALVEASPPRKDRKCQPLSRMLLIFPSCLTPPPHLCADPA